jgi:selenide,water dikinase
VTPALVDALHDPQTSGGLLAAVPADQARRAVERLEAAGAHAAAVIGEVTAGHPGRIRVEA